MRQIFVFILGFALLLPLTACGTEELDSDGSGASAETVKGWVDGLNVE